MKKSFFAAAVVALALVSCKKTEAAPATDAKVDSAVAAVDSAAVKVDSAAAKVEEVAKEATK